MTPNMSDGCISRWVYGFSDRLSGLRDISAASSSAVSKYSIIALDSSRLLSFVVSYRSETLSYTLHGSSDEADPFFFEKPVIRLFHVYLWFMIFSRMGALS
jgi:hypothetical protein